VVFRKDTVYTIITSGEARMDSIKMSMDNLTRDVDSGLKKTSQKFDSIASKVKSRLDSTKRK
jgi:hypothetical protein